MPDINERRSANGETRQWDGTAWRQVSADPPPQDNSATGALSRFMGGGLSTSPLNPMNLMRAIAHPVDTLSNFVSTPFENAAHAGHDVRMMLTGENSDIPKGVTDFARHAIGVIPGVGSGIVHAGETAKGGDIAGGAGQLAGLASAAYLPTVASKIPELPGVVGRGAGSLGRGMESAGVAAQNAKVPMLGAAEAIYRGDPKGLAVAATPYALEYGGKATQKLGSALEGLQGKVNLARGGQASVADAPFGPRAGSSEVRGSSFPSRPPMSPEDVGRADVGLDTEPAAAGPRIINRHDDMWGPGRAPALDPQVTTGFKGANNLKVDPSWDNDYLRQQLRDATDPAERDFLVKAYRQRLRVGDAMQGLQPQE